LPFHLSPWCIRAEFFSASLVCKTSLNVFGDRLYSSGAALRLEVLARFKFGRALTGACLDHVLLATVLSFIHRCCSIRCSALVPLQLHPCPLDDGRSTAEAAAVAARCGSASGLTHRPDIHGRAEDQSDDFVCSMGVVVQHLHDNRAVPRFFASAVELFPSVP
jgi:hypothetical protein